MARSRGERNERKASGAAPLERRTINRGCLFISLIVLVWNVGATWRHFYFALPPPSHSPSDRVSMQDARLSSVPAVDCAATGGSGRLTVRQRFLLGRKVDINRAGQDEISGLPGISDAVAGAVVEARDRIGRFRGPADLLQARGIKEKRLKKILPFLTGFDNN